MVYWALGTACNYIKRWRSPWEDAPGEAASGTVARLCSRQTEAPGFRPAPSRPEVVERDGGTLALALAWDQIPAQDSHFTDGAVEAQRG